ncbi:hypothetical protein TDB9533_03125 [Thalassocella blandensis]|nr:hypothetical protein TDB9533_03125 [Thalassocella blandensis]
MIWPWLATADPRLTEYTYLGGVDRAYEMAIIRLALEKTREEYGDFKLMEAPQMNEARGIASVMDNAYANSIRVSVYRKSFAQDAKISIVQFPIYLGVLGYRVCYVNNDSLAKLQHKSLDTDIKKLIHGQGEFWMDTDILRENGIKVVTGNKAENLYKMLSVKRMDLFCRGINEITSELKYAKLYSNISLDTSIAFYYEMPFFAYVNSQNKELFTRLDSGFKQAFNDGSLQRVWHEYYGRSVEESDLADRRIITLKNSELEKAKLNIAPFLYTF